MPKILVKSVFDTFDYVMDHYYPFGLEELTNKFDTYAIISIQDTHTNGFGVTFTKTHYCKDVLTLYFDDVVKQVEGTVPFNESMAHQIIDFVHANEDVDTLLIHCYAGESRSCAVAAAITSMLGQKNSKYFLFGSPNELVYETFMRVLKQS